MTTAITLNEINLHLVETQQQALAELKARYYNDQLDEEAAEFFDTETTRLRTLHTTIKRRVDTEREKRPAQPQLFVSPTAGSKVTA